MDESDFKNPNGCFELIGHGNSVGFVPNLLPPSLTVDEKILNKCLDLEKKLKELTDVLVGGTIDPYMLVSNVSYVTKINEALNSSKIEGTTTSFGEFLEYQANLGTMDTNSIYIESSNREVLNNLNAIEFMISQTGKDTYITLELICKCQKKLLTGIMPNSERNSDKTPDTIRMENARIGDKIICPSPGKLDALLGNFIEFINNDNSFSPLIRVAISHYQFESIHPFGDGNGRTGRIVMLALLIKYGLIDHPMISPSMFLQSNKRKYFDCLYQISTMSAWDEWFEFFIESIEIQIKMSKQIIGNYISQAESIESIFNKNKIYKTDQTRKVLYAIMQYPIFSVNQIEGRTGINQRTARNVIEKMVDIGLVKPFLHDGRTQKFICDHAMKIFKQYINKY